MKSTVCLLRHMLFQEKKFPFPVLIHFDKVLATECIKQFKMKKCMQRKVSKDPKRAKFKPPEVTQNISGYLSTEQQDSSSSSNQIDESTK